MELNINTKLDVGDNAFYVRDMGAFCSQVESILITKNGNEIVVNYNLADDSCYPEDGVFATFAECEPFVTGVETKLPTFDPNDPPLNVWIPWKPTTKRNDGPEIDGIELYRLYNGDVRFRDGEESIGDLCWDYEWDADDEHPIVAYRLTSKR